jgi:hypothetical protein
MFLFYQIKEPIPSYGLTIAKPNQSCTTNNMCLWHKTPVTTILATMAIVSHHPIIIFLYGIGTRGFTIDKVLPILSG